MFLTKSISLSLFIYGAQNNPSNLLNLKQNVYKTCCIFPNLRQVQTVQTNTNKLLSLFLRYHKNNIINHFVNLCTTYIKSFKMMSCNKTSWNGNIINTKKTKIQNLSKVTFWSTALRIWNFLVNYSMGFAILTLF